VAIPSSPRRKAGAWIQCHPVTTSADLPFAEASFAVVISLIGSMFAPRPELVASEMMRVCKPGGKIVIGQLDLERACGPDVQNSRKACSAASRSVALLWGDEPTCRQRFSEGVKDLRITRYMYPFQYPFPPAKVVDYFFEYYGPTNRAYGTLNEAGKKAFHEELPTLWSRNNTATDGTTMLSGE
jgi:SAM-dependent methyltransferase